MCLTFSAQNLNIFFFTVIIYFCYHLFFFTQFLIVFAAACETSLVVDAEMESVIAVTSVLCNTGAPPHLSSAGARRGSQTRNKQEGPRRDLGKMGTFGSIKNVWSNALNYWGQ